MAYVTHSHVWSYQVWNQRKTLGRKNPAELLGTGQECKDGLLPSVKRNIYESLEM